MLSSFTHGIPHGYNVGCRCDRCRKANTDRARARRQRLRELRQFVGGRWISPYAEHGTLNGYGNWQCRCWPCTDAHTVNLRRLRDARKKRNADAH